MKKAASEGLPGPLHVALLQLIRQCAKERNTEAGAKIASMSDRQLLKAMFGNLRTDDRGFTRGMRLTSMGLVLMRTYFGAFECKMPEGEKLSAPDLLYLDSKARMPYHASNDGFVVFETELGVKLKLAEGRVSTLIEMEGGWNRPA